MRLAAIDVGSNSVLLLVADVISGTIGTPLDEQVRITRLGERLAGDRVLPEEAMRRTLAVIADYKERAARLGAERTLVAATAAVREAANGTEFARRVQEATGLTLQVLSAQREAELGLLGVCSDPALKDAALLLLDIGGGSTELTAGGPGGLVGSTSVPVGCVRLRAQAGDARAESDLERMQRAAAVQLAAPMRRIARLAPGSHLVGIGGTITALGAVDLRLDEQRHREVDGHVLTAGRVRQLALEIAQVLPEERSRIAGLPKGREDTIVPGAAILLAAMQALEQDALRVSVRGLRYGLLSVSARPAKPAEA